MSAMFCFSHHIQTYVYVCVCVCAYVHMYVDFMCVSVCVGKPAPCASSAHTHIRQVHALPKTSFQSMQAKIKLEFCTLHFYVNPCTLANVIGILMFQCVGSY